MVPCTSLPLLCFRGDGFRRRWAPVPLLAVRYPVIGGVLLVASGHPVFAIGISGLVLTGILLLDLP